MSIATKIATEIKLQLRTIRSDKRGNFGIATAIILPCLIIATGCGLDLSRLVAARSAAQNAVDSAVLAAAASDAETSSELEDIASRFLSANVTNDDSKLTVTAFDYNSTQLTVSLSSGGEIPATFMTLAGIRTLTYKVHAEAKRSPPVALEVVLVLDNTWSMNGQKLEALKAAALRLVSIMEKGKTAARLGLVPYADYVNVGTQNRSQKWLEVKPDYTIKHKGSCWMETTRQSCSRGETRYCYRGVDGLPVKYDCTPYECTVVDITPSKKCSPDTEERMTWFGCVGSRTFDNLHLSDDTPSRPYPGILSTSQNCLSPVMPLTSSFNQIRSAITGMIVQVGDYQPSTYIPAGLIWGINLLSPTPPFTEAKPYDSDRRNPHKVMVLMTDGANTMVLNKTSGKHDPTDNEAELSRTYKDMLATCATAKAKKIDVYTISFMVEDERAKEAMKACASSLSWNFDANDSSGLTKSFENIARTFRSVILVK